MTSNRRYCVELFVLSLRVLHNTIFRCLGLRCRLSGLPIYAARGLRSGSAEITAVAFTVSGGWHFFWKRRCGNWTSSTWFQMWVWWRKPGAEEERKHAEIQIARVEGRKLCWLAFYAAIPREKTIAGKTAVKKASGSGRRKWPTEDVVV